MGLFSRFFGFAQKYDRKLPDTPENWQIGDIAECINCNGWFVNGMRAQPLDGPRYGRRYVVVRAFVAPLFGQRYTFLVLKGWHSSSFVSNAFRKVRPQSDEQTAADAAFTDLIRRTPQELPVTPTRELEEIGRG